MNAFLTVLAVSPAVLAFLLAPVVEVVSELRGAGKSNL